MAISPNPDVRLQWTGTQSAPPRRYQCAYCSHVVSSSLGIKGQASTLISSSQSKILVGYVADLRFCPDCSRPTYFEGELLGNAPQLQLPAPLLGVEVKHLPPEVAQLYDEARQCSAASAFTAAVLLARKLLMHIAVQQGAADNLNFVGFIDYLVSKGYMPPNGRAWVDRIRQRGNVANHEIVIMGRAEAEEVLTFLGMLMKFIYEMPGMLPPPANPT